MPEHRFVGWARRADPDTGRLAWQALTGPCETRAGARALLATFEPRSDAESRCVLPEGVRPDGPADWGGEGDGDAEAA